MDYRQKKKEWLEKHNFNENEMTYVYFPTDSYDVKEELKDAGFRFSHELLWHHNSTPEGYEDKVIEIKLSDVAEMAAWGEALFKPDVRQTVNAAILKARPVEISNSEWIGEEKERIYDLPVVIKSVREVDTKYGITNLVKFENERGDQITWWTKTTVQAEAGSKVLLTGTIKKLDEYMGVKTTILTRCKIKEM